MILAKKEQWQSVEGQSFLVKFEDGTHIDLTLDEVQLKSHLDTEQLENFSLHFSGPDTHQLIQATFWIEHPTLGAQYVFLVPVGLEEGRFRYEAVFSVNREPLGQNNEVPANAD